jgi:hypothetical protein
MCRVATYAGGLQAQLTVCSLRGAVTVTAVTSEMMGDAIDDATEVGVGRQTDRTTVAAGIFSAQGWDLAVGVGVWVSGSSWWPTDMA